MKLFFVFVFFAYCLQSFCQDSLTYRIDGFASVASGETTPFWIVNNTYGTVPLQSNNVYGRGDIYWSHRFNKDFRVESELDMEGATQHSASFFIQQLYASLSYKSINLTVGSKEYYGSMLDKRLSIGDFDYSPNARPIPEINLNVPEFTAIPYTRGILSFRGDFAVGKSTDSRYIVRTKYDGEIYDKDVLWHHKSLFFLFQDPEQHFPLSMTVGLVHAVQWGGWTSEDNLGELPHSFSDFAKIVLGEGGGDDASLGEQSNALGNHQGSYNLKIGYKTRHFDLAAYKQHYFDDKSGIEYANWRDGIWGVECSFFDQNYLKKAVFEYINTTDQSGPMHFLNSDKPGRGGGNDDYYNHTQYVSGWSHWGRSLGNPLMTSPEYSNKGVIYFQNNRVKAFHLGLEGDITPTLGYRVLTTGMYAWGRMSYPFLEKKKDISTLVECSYAYPKWKGWKFTLQAAFDTGSLYEDNIGCAIKISKSGFIRF